MKPNIVFPYIPNSTIHAKEKMMNSLNIHNLEELYAAIPDDLRLKRPLNLPSPILSEVELERYVNELLEKNISTCEVISFLGSGCYNHYVPAICDEINSRNEFLTVYSGKAYEDHGRYQALFEFQSMMADLLNMDVVALPTYDGFQASASALRMAANITRRKKILISKNIAPEKLSKIRDYIGSDVFIQPVEFDQTTGETDFESLQIHLDQDIAAVYFDNPNYFGVIESHGEDIASLAHKFGALCVVGTDPISLGILK
ncbi:MAG: aminomethyl-transferring glycine dehydrogenase, partial [Candidatus Kryptoniota bacterium]